MSLAKRHREFLTWVDSEANLETIRRFGHKVTHVGLFFFTVDATGTITGSVPANAAEVAAVWPHITWLLTVRNDGIESIWRALLTNQVAQDRFIAELHRILDQHPWVHGVDIDLEHGPNDLKDQIYQLYARIYSTIKSRSRQRHVHLDLPPMEGPGQTVGPEKWCEYERLRDLADTVQIMTYGFAWAGSAPGPTTPVNWLRRVMAYAVQAFDAERQVFMGVPQYGYRWQIYGYPGQPGVYPTGSYRGVGAGFGSFLDWMLGRLSHTDQYRSGTETQKYVPFASLYDTENYVHRLLLHVYDYPGAGEEDSLIYPMLADEWGGQKFLTCYSKQQRASFSGIVVDLRGTDYSQAEGAFVEDVESGAVSPRRPVVDPENQIEEKDCVITYTFSVPGGTYDVAVLVTFPWWDKQLLHFQLDGVDHYVGNMPQWYPYHRRTHWVRLATVDLTDGQHTLQLLGAGSQYGTVLLRVRVCSSFTDEFYGGEARFTIRPRRFMDVNRNPAWPYQGRFKVTLEVLRRAPEHAVIWYDDFRDWAVGPIPTNYYRVVSGLWTVGRDPQDSSPRPYSWVVGSGEFRLSYDGFRDITVEARVRLDGSGRAGVVFGNIWLAANSRSGQLELYQGATLLASYAAAIRTGRYYYLRLRVRGNEVTGYLGTSTVDLTPVLWATVATGPGSFGVKADAQATSDLLRAGDSYWLQPQEAIDVTLPDGRTLTIGRIPRTGVTWDNRWGFFRLGSGEEYDTRQPAPDGLPRDISTEWDFLHTDAFVLGTPSNYPVHIKVRDAGVWLSTLYLGDADGFSIAIFPDAETVLRLGDIAAYEFGVRGIGMWKAGLEDPQLWHMLVDHALPGS